MSEYKGYDPNVGKKAAIKYQKNNYDSVLLRFRKDGDDLKSIDEHLELTGEKRTEFIFRAIKETIARDRARMREGFRPEPREE